MDPDRVVSSSPVPDGDSMTMGDSTGLSDQLVSGGHTVLKYPHGHRLWSRPQASMWSLVTT